MITLNAIDLLKIQNEIAQMLHKEPQHFDVYVGSNDLLFIQTDFNNIYFRQYIQPIGGPNKRQFIETYILDAARYIDNATRNAQTSKTN